MRSVTGCRGDCWVSEALVAFEESHAAAPLRARAAVFISAVGALPRIHKLFRYHQVRRADERRLMLFVGISVMLHALAMAWVATAARPAPPSAAASVPIAVILQAALSAPPKPESAPPAQPEPVAQIAGALPAPHPSIEQDKAAVLERHAPKSKQESSAEGAIGLPMGNVIVGVMPDATLSPDLRAHARAAFPTPAQREPRLRGAVVVSYPQRALQARMNKRMLALVFVDAAGRVTETELHPSDPWFGPVIDDALKTARFTPAERDGNRVPYWIAMSFEFTVAGGSDARETVAR